MISPQIFLQGKVRQAQPTSPPPVATVSTTLAEPPCLLREALCFCDSRCCFGCRFFKQNLALDS